MFAERKVLVTGGTGLIGAHFVEELLRRGARLRIVVHRRSNPFGDRVEVVSGDLRRWETCTQAVEGVDHVIHAAGVGGGSKKVAVEPIAMFTDNLVMNSQMLEAARLARVQRYLFVSNSSVYAQSEEPLVEEDAWGETARGVPENETGIVKRTGESQCRLYARVSDTRVGIIRGGGAYGPYDNFDLEASHVVPALIRKAVERHDPYMVWGHGDTVRDFTHARDIARGGLFVLEHYCVCDPVNIATGVSLTIRELVALIGRIAAHRPAEVRFDPSAPATSRVKRLDVTKMKRLGFTPHIALGDGLRETIAWYRNHAPAA